MFSGQFQVASFQCPVFCQPSTVNCQLSTVNRKLITVIPIAMLIPEETI